LYKGSELHWGQALKQQSKLIIVRLMSAGMKFDWFAWSAVTLLQRAKTKSSRQGQQWFEVEILADVLVWFVLAVM
jgi:hypothetical protein